MNKITKKSRKNVLLYLLKFAKCNCNDYDDKYKDILSNFMKYLESIGYDFSEEKTVKKKIDPISGSPFSAYTIQSQLPTNGVGSDGDNSNSIYDDNIRSISKGLAEISLI